MLALNTEYISDSPSKLLLFDEEPNIIPIRFAFELAVTERFAIISLPFLFNPITVKR